MLARLFFVFCLLWAGVSDVAAVDRIIAVVNQDTITQSEADVYLSIISLQLSRQYKGIELDERMKEEKEQLISKMVEDKIILQEAKLHKSAYARDTISKEQIRPELQEGFSGLKALEISDPVKAGNGYYIFKIIEILPPKVQSLSEVHDRIYSYLSEEKFAVAMLEWIEGLKEKAYIQIKQE